MASEATIERVLNLLTKAPKARIESLRRAGAPDQAKSMRRIIGTSNVVAVGISEKITKEEPTGRLALTFYVERKVSLKKLRADALIPPTVPESLSGPEAVPTDVIVLGKLRPEVNAVRHPVQPGNSIGHADITAGTLGGIVRKGGRYYLLSNSHVLALGGTAKRGDAIIYPGDLDGGRVPDDVVGKLASFKKFIVGSDFVNRVDCAIAKPNPAREAELMSQIRKLAVPKGVIAPRRGMRVVKVGRTTGKTFGEIRDIHFRFALEYDEVGEVGFIDQVLCTRYTDGGDSGSLVLDAESGKAVGLHFAGANGGSVFNPIGDVLKALRVTLVTTSISGPQARGRRSRKGTSKRPRKLTSKKR